METNQSSYMSLSEADVWQMPGTMRATCPLTMYQQVGL